MANKLQANFEIVSDKSKNAVTSTPYIKHNGQWLDEVVEEAKNNYVTPEMFGAVGDGETDDSEAIMLALDYVNAKSIPLFFGAKSYYVGSTIDFSKLERTSDVGDNDYTITIMGNTKLSTKIIFNKNLKYGFYYDGINGARSFVLKNLCVLTDNTNESVRPEYNGIYLKNSPKSHFENLYVRNCNYGIYQSLCWLSKYINVTSAVCNYGIYIDGINEESGDSCHADQIYMENVYVGNNPKIAGLTLKGSTNTIINALNAEAGTSGNALVIEGSRNIQINGFYCESWLGASPVWIKHISTNSTLTLSKNIQINNSKFYNTMSPFYITGGLFITIDGIVQENKAFVDSEHEPHPIPRIVSSSNLSLGDTTKFINHIDIKNFTNLIDTGITTVYSSIVSYNGLMYRDSQSLPYYRMTYETGDKIVNVSINKMFVVSSSGSYGAEPNCTITGNDGSVFATVSNSENLFVNEYINVGIDTRVKIIQIDGNNIVFERPLSESVSNINVTVCNPDFIEVSTTATSDVNVTYSSGVSKVAGGIYTTGNIVTVSLCIKVDSAISRYGVLFELPFKVKRGYLNAISGGVAYALSTEADESKKINLDNGSMSTGYYTITGSFKKA